MQNFFYSARAEELRENYSQRVQIIK